MTDMRSPCINVCAIDPDSRVCMGCYRTLEEIAAWASLTPDARATILETLAERRRSLGPFRVAKRHKW